jgi:beta-N-acetylhexosaminidase
MEGRPPFDPDDELDFDFESIRRRRWERLEQEPGARRRVPDETEERPSPEPDEYPSEESPSGEYGTEPPSEEFPSGEESQYDPFESERRARGERPRRRGLPFGRRRRRDRRERRERLRDDPYTPTESEAPGTRRSRHRDLPAKVRRRQAFGAGAVVLALIAGLYLLIGGLFGGDGDQEEELAMKRLIGQSFVGRMGPQGPTPELTKRVRKGQLGGVIVQPSDEASLTEGVAQLQQAARAGGNPPLLVMIDQEGGDIKRLPGPPDISPVDLGEGGDPEIARNEGEKTGTYLAGAGVDVDLAPVLDVRLPQTADTIADRTYGEDPALVSELGSAFIEGLQSQGVAATAKHFPGLGPATLNTDFSPVTVAARQEDLDAALQPFQAAVEGGVQLVMMSSAAYPSLAGHTPGEGRVLPAVFAEPIVGGLLRGELGFDGVVITDDLESIAIKTLSNRAIAAVRALAAGCDLVLYARSERGSEEGFAAVLKAVKRGTLTREQLEVPYNRVTALKDALGSG